MRRRDRADLVVAELEARGEAGEEITQELAEDAIRRNALGEDELPRLRREVLWALDARGYDVAAPVRPGWWGLAGAVSLATWILLVLGALKVLGVI